MLLEGRGIFIYYLILYNLMNKARIIRTLRKSGTSLTVSIPPEIISLLDLKEGNILELELKKLKLK